MKPDVPTRNASAWSRALIAAGTVFLIVALGALVGEEIAAHFPDAWVNVRSWPLWAKLATFGALLLLTGVLRADWQEDPPPRPHRPPPKPGDRTARCGAVSTDAVGEIRCTLPRGHLGMHAADHGPTGTTWT